ncbi:MAG: isoprenoid biosynthesis protein ElbB [Bacteroidetes bacterium 4572_117]|nr:MAG: isoprenoid biosynthesis protein ElbB [Bacteroidetes bacterium 4572_117]
MKKFAVVLSGSGVYDGAEIHEATMTLYAIMKNGGEYEIFAPNIDQHHVINHITGEEMKESRNVLIESARIARGNIKNLNEFDATDFDAIIFPGGFGVAKNLSSFAFEGADCKVNADVEKSILEMVKAGKPIGALCISPAVMAKVLKGAQLTIGSDKETAEAIEKMGATHKTTTHGEVVVDEGFKLVTTPCYMLDATILDIANGANNVVKTMIGM